MADPKFQAPTGTNYPMLARQLVVNEFNANVDATDEFRLKDEDTFVVWFAKTLKNWKALVSTTVPDGKYYEVTFDGANNRAFIDTYVKHKNTCVPFSENPPTHVTVQA